MTNNVADTNVGKMTEEEAIVRIKEVDRFIDKNPSMFEYDDVSWCDYGNALNMAIEALRFQQKFVTCKDCKHWDLSESYGFARMCEHWQDTMREYGYCSYGERRDEE